MNTYTSPEAIEIGAADEVILGMKYGPVWDSIEQQFAMNDPSAVDADE